MTKGPNVVIDANISETWWDLPKDYRKQVMDWLEAHGVDVQGLIRAEIFDGYMICTVYVRDAEGNTLTNAKGDGPLTKRVHKEIRTPMPERLTGL